ncbi:methyl-accepting chemotaxis protein [Herbaspirillum sp. DW155]|uniref:methyl-accepting chemotaxis protein n=1 Tax=Herbaspirillum sp. DW155 TaxID=3095609 RepID=UPI00308EDD08|nr:methyl-accepting chemotaxis protein [Herbaspirillum sp. DW155]
MQALDTALHNSRKSEILNLLSKAEYLVTGYQQQVADGKLRAEDAQQAVRSALSALNANRTSYFFVMRPDGLMLVHPNRDLIGRKMLGQGAVPGQTDLQAYREGLDKGHFALVDVVVKRSADGQLERKLQGLVEVPQWNWYIGTGFFYDDINAVYWEVATRLLGVGIAIFLALGTIAWLIARSVRQVLGGEPAHAGAIVAKIAAGDLSCTIELAQQDSSSLLFSLNEMRQRLSAMVRGILQSSEAISTGSREIARGNLDLSQRTEAQAASLEQTAASMAELANTIHQNRVSVGKASEMAQQALLSTQDGGQIIEEVIGTIQGIAAQSKEIAQITGLIEGIAFQTNILALNAAVEAARAGEQGRGFAVVATEVRSLAQKSAGAAKDIKQLIDSSVMRVTEGNRQVSSAGQQMASITQAVERVSQIMKAIDDEAAEQSNGIQQVNVAVMQMDQVTQQNAALVEEITAASAMLDDQSKQLLEIVSRFSLR